MKTIICRESKEQFYGRIIDGTRQHINKFGNIVDCWNFELIIADKPVIWENCLSDYWELVDTDLRKVSEVLSVEESSEVGLLDKIKHILKWGCCK